MINKRDKGTKTKTKRGRGRKKQRPYNLVRKLTNQRGVPKADMIINGSEQSIFLHSADLSKIGEAREEGEGRGQRGKQSGKGVLLEREKDNSNRHEEEDKKKGRK